MNGLNCYLRAVELDDAKLLYIWRNEKETRKNSFNSNLIDFNEHLNWLEKKLENNARLFYILVCDGMEVGQVRVDIEGKIGVVNYSIDSKYRKMGYGKSILELAEQELLKNAANLKKIVGYVKSENVASRHIFQILNYQEELKGNMCIYTKSLID